MKSMLAALGLATATLAPIASAHAAPPPPPPPVEMPGADLGPPPHHGPGRFNPESMRRMHERMQEKLATRLAAAEVELGIRSAQIDPWRDFTSAVLAFFTPPESPKPPRPPAPLADDATPPPPPESRLERIAAMASDRATKAEALAKAATALDGVLTPEQKTLLAKIELMPPPGGHGPKPFDRMGPDRHHPRPGKGPGADMGPAGDMGNAGDMGPDGDAPPPPVGDGQAD